MPAKAQVTAEEFTTLPEPVQSLYVQDGDAYKLTIEDGMGDTASLRKALEAERTQRQTFEKEVRALRGRYKDLDPEKAREALGRLQEMEDKQLLDTGKVEELLTKRTERMRLDFENQQKAYQQQMTALEQERGNLTTRLEEVLIDTGLTQACIKARVKESAIADVLLRGRRVWHLRDGKPLPLRDDGETVLYGKNPSVPMSMEEWVASLQSDAPHLFEENRGGGTAPGGRPSSSGGRIVLSREQARDVRTWRQASDEAARSGAQLVVQD